MKRNENYYRVYLDETLVKEFPYLDEDYSRAMTFAISFAVKLQKTHLNSDIRVTFAEQQPVDWDGSLGLGY